jgi:predicted component of type VI protein secretion system
MPWITVQVLDTGTNSTNLYEFDRSPVRIGRNPLNDISLEQGFVSQWHGLIRFDDLALEYSDLGSTNGTVIQGRRVAKNVPMPLANGGSFDIGPMRLVVSRKAPTAVGTQSGAQRRTRSVFMDAQAMAAATEGRPITPAPPGGLTPPPRGADGGLLGLLQDFLRAYGSGPSVRGDADAYELLKRLLMLVEAFTAGLLGLRRGYEQFGNEIGLRVIKGNTPLHNGRDARTLLSYLTDPRADSNARVEEVISLFADFGIHQVALVQAVSESVRAMLERLDPAASEGGTSGGGRLWPFRKGQKEDVLQALADIRDDDQGRHAAIFGRDFVMAYARVLHGRGGADNSGPIDGGEGDA